MNDTLTIERLYDLPPGPMAEAFADGEGQALRRPAALVCRTPNALACWLNDSGAHAGGGPPGQENEGRPAQSSRPLRSTADRLPPPHATRAGSIGPPFLELAELGFLSRVPATVIVTGATGLGKTYLACALAQDRPPSEGATRRSTVGGRADLRAGPGAGRSAAT